MTSSSSREHQRRRAKQRKESARKGSGGGVLEMAKEGQTTSRLGSQLVFNGVQKVGVALDDGDMEKRVASFRVATDGR